MTPEERAANAWAAMYKVQNIRAAGSIAGKAYPWGETAKEIIATAIREAEQAAREEAAQTCEAMVVGGRAWNEGQAIAADALFAAAKNIRTRALRGPRCAECGGPRATGRDMKRAHNEALPDEVQDWEAALCWAHTPEGPHAKPLPLEKPREEKSNHE